MDDKKGSIFKLQERGVIVPIFPESNGGYYRPYFDDEGAIQADHVVLTGNGADNVNDGE
jgi:hypothetical protein